MKSSKLRGLKSGVYDRRRERRKAERRLCIRKHCRRQPRAHRRVCDTCESREKFAKHPILRLFHNLKSHAKTRKIPFALTYEWFKAWAIRCGYDRLHGCKKNSVTVDRRNHKKGYVRGNIRPLSHSQNSRKGWYERHGKPWEQSQSQDDFDPDTMKDDARQRVIDELHRFYSTETSNDLLNALCDQGLTSDSIELLSDVPNGDLVRALNATREAV
jgi:hypothetical protein